MEDSVNQFIMMVIYAIISFICISIVMMILNGNDIQNLFLFHENDAGNQFYLSEREKVIINVLNNEIHIGEEFNPLDCIELYFEGKIQCDLLKEVEVYGYVNTKVQGIYPMTYVIRHNDIVSQKEVSFKVI